MRRRVIVLIAMLFAMLLGASGAVGDRYELVTDTEMLADSDEVIIVCRDYGVAMSNVSEKTYLCSTPIVFDDGGAVAVVSQDNTLVLRLRKASGYWRLASGDDYLCASGSGSYVLTLGTKNNRNGVNKADIDFDADGNACIDFQVPSYKRIKYNGTDRFACYYTYGMQPSVQLYRKERKVPVVDAMVLDELADNAALVADNYSAKVRSMTIGRTFAADGGCYTLCLPFALTADDIADVFRGAALYEYCGVAATADSVVFRFRSVQRAVAGTPYIIVPQKQRGGDIASVELHDKQLTALHPATTSFKSGGKTYSFVGTYSPVELHADGSVRFVGNGGNKLVTPNQTAPLRGLRAYFVLPEAVPSANADAAQGERLCMISLDGHTTALQDVSAKGVNGHEDRVFTLSGQATSGKPKRGVYVQNGKKIAARP